MEINNIKVTIGIPVFNAGKYLKFAIDSVLAQTYQNIEIIISIDGATDNSLDIISTYKDPRIHLIHGTENKGISFRLNQQIGLAKGEYYARMDADDIMFPDRIEKQVKFMTENPDVEVIGSQAVVLNGENRIIGFRECSQSFSKLTILKNILFIHPTVFGKTIWFRKNPYSSEFDGVEDFYLWNKTFNQSKFMVQSEPLLFYRDPPLSNVMTYFKRQKQFRKALAVFIKETMISYTRYYEMYILSIIKTLIYFIFWKFGISQILIRNRNNILSQEELTYYSGILKRIVIPD
jgi:glycosyltransferase involved in cell wall biosynthesis